MDIAEVVKQSGVPASALRYYEQKGLIVSEREPGARRRYGSGVLEQLALIALGQAAGLSLDEIRSMLSPHGGPRVDRQLLDAKADAIDRQILRLKAMSRGLRHAAACPAPSHTECPSFRKLLKAAASGALEQRWGTPAKHPARAGSSRRAA